MLPKNKEIMDNSFHDAINITGDENTIFITFGTIKNIKDEQIDVKNEVKVIITPDSLKDIISHLINFGIRYQEKYKKEIGFKLPIENT